MNGERRLRTHPAGALFPWKENVLHSHPTGFLPWMTFWIADMKPEQSKLGLPAPPH
jgi:hypothetical protein